jgi:hypothetical protein
MGFFKDVRTLSKQGNEINRNRDMAAEMAAASAAMTQANQFLADQAAATRLAAAPRASLQVLAARDTGTVVNMQAVLELDLLVQAEGGVPFPATVRQLVPSAALGRVVPGSVLTGRAEPADPTTVWIDWTA